MEDKIFDIITDLLRHDINKDNAIEQILNYFNKVEIYIATDKKDNKIKKYIFSEGYAKMYYDGTSALYNWEIVNRFKNE